MVEMLWTLLLLLVIGAAACVTASLIQDSDCPDSDPPQADDSDNRHDPQDDLPDTREIPTFVSTPDTDEIPF